MTIEQFQSLDGNFGKLLEMGFDIIQTDWPYLLSSYIKNKQNKGESL